MSPNQSSAEPARPAHLALFALLFLALAVICALPRFGQRENESLPVVSDSDCYMDMARVFLGDAPYFNPEWVKTGPHHYSRPLFPFLAGWLARGILGGNLRAAFSVIDIVAAALTATLLMGVIQRSRPEWRLAWLPSALLVTGFPQMNWGYHILTDTLGIATAFAAACYAERLVRQADQPTAWRWPRWLGGCVLLSGVSSIAFLTRETGWIAVVATTWLIFLRRGSAAPTLIHCGWVFAALLAGKVGHSVYSYHFALKGVPLGASIAHMFDVRYMLDLAVKTGVCFNLAWLLAFAAWFKSRARGVPPLIWGWTMGAILYIGAGYFVNFMQYSGYPLRMSYSLFPLVFFAATEAFERFASPRRRVGLAVGYLLLQVAINFLGVFLDPAQGKITVVDLMEKLRSFGRN